MQLSAKDWIFWKSRRFPVNPRRKEKKTLKTRTWDSLLWLVPVLKVLKPFEVSLIYYFQDLRHKNPDKWPAVFLLTLKTVPTQGISGPSQWDTLCKQVSRVPMQKREISHSGDGGWWGRDNYYKVTVFP